MTEFWTTRQYYERVAEIEKKYEPLRMAYARFSNMLSAQQRLALIESKLMYRVKGLQTALSMLDAPIVRDARARERREVCIRNLERQVNEPSVPPEFAEVVQFVLDDMKSDIVVPLKKISGLLEDRVC